MLIKKTILSLILFCIIPNLFFCQQSADSLRPIVLNEKWGYVNNKGETIVKPQFDFANEFSEGLAAVEIGSKYGYINTSGTIIIELQYDYASDFSEELAQVNLPNKSGFINKDAKFEIVLSKGISVEGFSNGLAAYKEKEKWGYIDKTGKTIVKPKFCDFEIYHFFRNNIVFESEYDYIANECKLFYYGKDGNKKFEYDGYPFSEGLAVVLLKNKYGFIDTTGKMIIKPKFEKIPIFLNPLKVGFSEGLACVKYKGKWGAIDKKGKFIIKPTFDEILTPFQEGLAAVKINNKIGFINNEGKVIIPCEYDTLKLESPNVINVGFKNGLCLVTKGNLWGYINKKGALVWQSK